jgi:crotonobetainyl-CoA:carnitine CoA-transferase CaiB-like acyl-CoA transferase
MTVEMPHPLVDAVTLVASPLKLSQTPVQYRRPPPLLGEHTREVLVEFGIGDAEQAALKEQGVL